MINLFSDKSICCGCTACASICPKNAIIYNENDASGFAYPEVNRNLCVECGMCKTICAFDKDVIDNINDTQPKVYAVLNKDESVRLKSSSGGLFSALASVVIDQKGVAFDENFKVKYVRAIDLSGIETMRAFKLWFSVSIVA